MCGIIGQIMFGGAEPDLNKLKCQAAFMNSRGPDSEGFWLRDNVALGHKRLSIVDLSANGHQPMISNNGNVVIVFNGEIYNFKILRKRLETEGVKFLSNSDTEVLIEGYLHWGIEKLVANIDGMFAFCLYDLEKRVCYFSRDPFGKKPLYFSHSHKQFIFSSDIRIVSVFLENRTLDLESVDFYFQELGMPQPKTIWKEVRQLSPGILMCLDCATGKLKEKKIHEFQFNKIRISLNEALELTEKKLIDSILKRTISDVPIGCFLSAGIDSGLITSLLASNTSERVNTFTIGFEGSDFNETKEARVLAERYGTNHQCILISDSVSDLIPTILDEMGEPLADSSLIPSYLVCREMSKHYKVALSGDGGDELFGYNNYNYAYNLEQLMKLGSLKRMGKIYLSKFLYRFGFAKNLGIYEGDLRLLKTEKLVRRNMLFSDIDLDRMTNAKMGNYTNYHIAKLMAEIDGSIYDKVVYGSLKTRLLCDNLVKMDRSSMMNSLEVRSPFLDTSLADFAFSIPGELVYKNGITKFILKELAKKYIDPKIINRKKQGFSLPIGELLRTELRSSLLELCSAENLSLHGLLNKEELDRIIHQHITRLADHGQRLWSIYCFQYWFLKYGR